MAHFKDRIVRLLPRRARAIVRPLYYRSRELLPGRNVDRSSNLAIGSFGGFEVAYRKNTADEAVVWETFETNIFFGGVPEYEPADGHVIIDVGAHIGTFSLQASSRVGSGRVYAIEASGDTFNLLRINVALNQRTNISAHHLALGDKDGTGTLHHGSTNWGHSTVMKLSGSSETVRSSTLSTFLQSNRIAHCHFMKLNCEGAEFPVLLSTPPEVLRRIETLLVLYHSHLWPKNTEADLVSYLESCGYRCSIRNRQEEEGWIIAERIEAQELDTLGGA
jgi:FkbM family methyltransferase